MNNSEYRHVPSSLALAQPGEMRRITRLLIGAPELRPSGQRCWVFGLVPAARQCGQAVWWAW